MLTILRKCKQGKVANIMEVTIQQIYYVFVVSYDFMQVTC